jgi:predicted secreted protein
MKETSLVGRRAFVSSLAGIGLLLSKCSNAEAERPQPEQNEKWILPDKNQIKREFDEIRSRKVVYLSHCMLNQNARITTAADFPAMFAPLVEWLKEHHIGIIQMPCPELMVLGLGRVSVRDGLETKEGHAHLHQIIDSLIYEIKQYQFQGFEVVGVMGKQGSPACGVTKTWLDGRHQPGIGVYIRLLQERLAREQLAVEVIGVADHEQQKAIDWLTQRV